MSAQRSFTRVKSSGGTEGVYKSSTPSGAARKAFGKMEKSSATITIRETTQGCKNKDYKYRCERVELKKPRKVERDGVIIKYRFETTVKAV